LNAFWKRCHYILTEKIKKYFSKLVEIFKMVVGHFQCHFCEDKTARRFQKVFIWRNRTQTDRYIAKTGKSRHIGFLRHFEEWFNSSLLKELFKMGSHVTIG
jgi:hypothetical protein